MSHRYGSITLPTRIIKEEYELFGKNIEANKLDLTFHYDNSTDANLSTKTAELKIELDNIFVDCYELDENEIPARYKLKHLDRLLPGFVDKVKYELQF